MIPWYVVVERGTLQGAWLHFSRNQEKGDNSPSSQMQLPLGIWFYPHDDPDDPNTGESALRGAWRKERPINSNTEGHHIDHLCILLFLPGCHTDIYIYL